MGRQLFTLTFIFTFFSFLGSACFAQEEPSPVVSAPAPIRILLVPGHDNESSGAQYGNVKEASMNLAVASRIYNILKKDERFDVYITRDTKGYTKEFADYFADTKSEIRSFITEAKKSTKDQVANGDFVEKQNVPHNKASPDMALRLYGFNKWASDNKMDAVIHVHFNDYPRKYKWTVGKYTGFAIYIPDEQFENSETSLNLANNIFYKLKTKYKTSNYVNELGGIIYDQKLIATGANNTLDASVRSVLIEYGYIYDKKLKTSTMRQRAYSNMAKLTAGGIEDYFFPEAEPSE